MNGNIYTVTATDANGCTATAQTAIAVNALPTPTASNNGPVCSGQTITFTATGGVSYAWSGPNGFTSTTNPATTTVTTAQNGGVYTVTATDANGCSATATTTITVNPSPTAPIVTNYAICQNGVVPAGQGLTGSCPSGGGGGPIPGTQSFSASGPFNVTQTTVNTYQPGNLTVTIPAGSIPAGATITSVNTLISYTTNASTNPAWLSELLVRITPPVSFAPQRTDIDMGSSPGVPASGTGTLSNIVINSGSPWPNNNPTGNWIFEFATQFVGVPPSHTINTVTVQVNYTTLNEQLSWWTAPTGGTQIALSSPFDPTDFSVASGGVNPAVVDTTTYYAQCTNVNTGCTSPRTAANFSVDPPASANAGADIDCQAGGAPITLSGSVGGTATSGTWATLGSGTFNNPTLLNATYTPSGADVSAGSVRLVLTTNDPIGGCVSDTDTLRISFNPLPPLTADYTTCPFVAPPTGEGLSATCPTTSPRPVRCPSLRQVHLR